jgi:hypothetical protein
MTQAPASFVVQSPIPLSLKTYVASMTEPLRFTLPVETAPSGTTLSRGTEVNGPITQSRPMLLPQPMNVNGWITVSCPIVTPDSM